MEEYRWLLIAIMLLLLTVYTLYRKSRRANPWGRTPYERQEYFLSPAEKNFYDVLLRLVGENYTICPKPSVREILRVSCNVHRDRQKYFNWISQKHVDFVLCRRDTMEIICAVELDDSSHDRRDRRQRDAFMDKAFGKAKLPLFHIPCRKSYGRKELEALADFLYDNKQQMPEQDDLDRGVCGEEAFEIPLCPDCGVPMVLRTATKGSRQGEQFYGCPNFPHCRQTRSLW